MKQLCNWKKSNHVKHIKKVFCCSGSSKKPFTFVPTHIN